MSSKYGYSQSIISATNNNELKGLGIELGRMCVRNQYSVAEVAQVLKVSRQTIYNWFTGKGNPRKRYEEQVTALIEKLKQVTPTADE
jgi:transposase